VEYTTQNSLPVAALENKSGNYIAPTPESAARTLEAVEPADDLIAFITDPAGEQSYPLSPTPGFWLDQYQDPDKAQVLEDFVGWALTEGQNTVHNWDTSLCQSCG